MCGISGIFNFSGSVVDQIILQRMNDAIAHRGPDGEGYWSVGPVGFGHRRLAIRGLGDEGHQPMLDSTDTVCVTYNGEIYNYLELRESLEEEFGVVFKSRCDTEIIPYGWLAWGSKLFDYIEGMYAVGIWDSRANKLTLARDGIGIKPLYYSIKNSSLYFSSEIKGISATRKIDDNIDPIAFYSFLSNGYTEPTKTLSPDIHQVRPGSYIQFDTDGISEEAQFWSPRRNPSIESMDTAVSGLIDVMEDVCSDMMVSDVPLGLLLSSGIDSSLIALTVKKPLTCYTTTFAEKDFDESSVAKSVASIAGHRWVSEQASSKYSPVDDFYAVARAVDGQLGDSSCLAHYSLSRQVSKQVKVALAGDGADEFFGGYPTYKASRVASKIAPFVPKNVSNKLSEFLKLQYSGDEGRVPWHDVMSRFLAGLNAPRQTYHTEWRRLASTKAIAEIASPYFLEVLSSDPLVGYRKEFENAYGSFEDKCLLADERFYLPSDMIVKVDRMSMANGVEIRVPFLDRRIMDYAGKIDHTLFFSMFGDGKKILRQAASQLGAPKTVVKAKKKGFNVPLAKLLRTELRPVGDKIIMQNADVFSPFLDPDKLRKLWQLHLDSRVNASYLLWSILIFGAWRLDH